ncbi:hypothetical protein LN042_11215 [Kitasatospora sp. RB6PN24]|uniref:hypothetical protein n=1 Tax=Kitasatospora humi TaxID=2893891 RepID=UPI001E510172|nr:hypothetical protein [Kitasatospora humi]MCC9307664.1 hypothetical protein [Kitasatospora humi]
MPDALPIPDDLVQLQRDRIAAENALAEYVTAVETRRRAAYPEPEQVVHRVTWTDEESARYKQLRAARDDLMWQVRRHPTIARAFEERCWPQTWEALQAAARASSS